MPRRLSRRRFLQAAGAASTGLLILQPGTLTGAAPSSKLNLAVIGVGGRGGANLGGVAGENIVALCDVNDQTLAKAAAKYPQAKTYHDWRKCLDQKDIDAVVCSTTDHTHAFVSTWALQRGKHVYCEKPIGNSVHEARTVREAYLAQNGKVATQQGTQIHATTTYRRIVELAQSGVIGAIKEVHAWCGRTPAGGSYLPAVEPVPAHLHWDLWLGPAPFHPYNPGYLGGCLAWNRYWDFGSGQIGDMGSHILDLAYWAMDLSFPTSCAAQGSPVHPDTCPTWLTAQWDHPATPKRPALKLFWYDGDKKPQIDGVDLSKRFKGVLFIGEKGMLLGDYDLCKLLPEDQFKDHKFTGTPIPPSPNHYKEWLEAAKTGKPEQALCNFDYAGKLIEHNLLALVAYRVGKKLAWDAPSLKATNCPEADPYIRKTYRAGWTLKG